MNNQPLFRSDWQRACNIHRMANYVRDPEVYRAGEPLPVRRHDPFIETIAHVMDGLIPIGRFSIGLDSIIGLIPGIGDIIGALIGMLIVLRAVQAGIPRVAIARMMTNIAIDTFVGAIPLIGDAFDFVYKSNKMNMRIYEEALEGRQSNARHWVFFILLFVGVAAVIWLAVWAVLGMVRGLKLF